MKLLARYYAVFLVWFFGFILSYAMFSTVQYYESQYKNHVFKSSFNDKVTSLTQAVSAIDKVFFATQSLLTVVPQLTSQGFSQLVNKEFLSHTGMQGLQWAPLVLTKNLASFELKVRASGIFDYRVYPTQGNCYSAYRNAIFPVLFAEPFDTIGHKLGHQLSSDCDIANSMAEAIRSKKITTSQFITENNASGLRLLKPVFSADGQLRGFVVGIVMINRLVDTLWGDMMAEDNYQIVIFNDADKKQQLYRSQWREDCAEDCSSQSAYLQIESSIPFANQLWHIEFSQRVINSRDVVLPYASALLILLLALGLSVYLWMNSNRIRWAHKLVDERTESLQYQASHDELTKLYNKQTLTDILTKKTKHITNKPFSVLFIDLDHFKKINDTMGHLVGDKLLKQVAKRLTESARSHDDIFRFGGDEFVVILNNNSNKVMVDNVANRLLSKLIKEYKIDGGCYRIGASIGVSIIDDLNTNCDTIIRNADIAMYEAKNSGRGRVIFYHDNMYKKIVNKQDIEDSLCLAVVNKELRLHLQPIFSNQQVLIGFEALSRWLHPEKGLVMPDRFIPIAEENGVIHQIGHWVIESVCAQLRDWVDIYGVNNCPYISINVSPYQLAKYNVVTEVKTALALYKIPAKLLAIELTESALIENKATVKAHLMELRELGIRIFLDDFGTGFSSLSLLQSFPIDVIKIDRSFISGISENNRESKKLVTAIISMSDALNMAIIAEGVEDNLTLEWLSRINCQSMQGYYFSNPLDAEELPTFLKRHLVPIIGASSIVSFKQRA